MTTPTPFSCDDFDGEAADLALGHVGEPRRSDLMHHAGNCAACDRRFADLVTIADRMLELAPEAEPPAGFETRTVARMSASPSRRRVPRAALAGAAVLLVAVLGVWTIVGGSAGDRSETIVAPVLSRSGDPIGIAELDRASSPRLIVTMDGPSDWTGVWTCEVRADGSWVEVGSWTADEVTNGVWAAGLPRSAADPTAMRILGDSGSVIATADLAEPANP